MNQGDFDGAVEGFRLALEPLLNGDPAPVLDFWSRRDDVTLANPFGPPCRGPAAVVRATEEASDHFRDGSVRHIEEVSRYSTPDLGYIVQLEETEAKLPGSETMTSFTLRVTMIFRREGDAWKISHRQADSITTARPVSSLVEA